MARTFLTLLQHWSVRSCVRPVCAACMAAGHNAFRGSGPNRKPALEGAMTHTGSPDPSIDLVCITSFALTNSFGRSVRWRSSCRQHQNRLVVSLLLTRLSYATSMPQRRRRPQHHNRTNRPGPKSDVWPLLSESGHTIAMQRLSALGQKRTSDALATAPEKHLVFVRSPKASRWRLSRCGSSSRTFLSSSRSKEWCGNSRPPDRRSRRDKRGL